MDESTDGFRDKRLFNRLTFDLFFLSRHNLYWNYCDFLCFIAEAFMQALLHTQNKNLMLTAKSLRELCMYTLNLWSHHYT